MTFEKKFYLTLSITLVLGSLFYFMFADHHVATHKIKGRIVSIEKMFWRDVWTLTLFSDGEVYEIEVADELSVKELKQYNEKYILVTYREYLFGGALSLKHRMQSWTYYEYSKSKNTLNAKALKQVDQHLTCSLVAQLQNNVELSEQVLDYLEHNDFDTKGLVEKCSM